MITEDFAIYGQLLWASLHDFANYLIHLVECIINFNTRDYHTLRHDIINEGVQWLSGRVLDLRPRGSGFKPHRRHWVKSLSKNINPGSQEDPSLYN